MPEKPASPLDRGEFPLLQRLVGCDGARPLVYLDSAASALVPERVIRAVERYLRTSCANIHRGAHRLAEESTDEYECAREHVAAFFETADPSRVLFVQNATEACNLAAFGWGANVLGPGDMVAVAEDNHHANIDVPALARALDSRAFYVGSLGRASTQLSRYRQLRGLGYADEAIARVFGPIGLDLRGREPAEIALSIMAEITAVRHGGRFSMSTMLASARAEMEKEAALR